MRYRGRRFHRNWVSPEMMSFPEDAGRDQFYVYVLDTLAGNYIGHTWNVGRRFLAHQRNEVPTTQGTKPKLIWISRPEKTRAGAQSFEAVLKSWNQRRHPRFKEITGCEPVPFISKDRMPAPRRSPAPAAPVEPRPEPSLIVAALGGLLISIFRRRGRRA